MSEKKYMSQAEYARYRGVDDAVVAKAIRTGRITAELDADGRKKINPELADKEWKQNTFVGNVRKDGQSIINEVSKPIPSNEVKKTEVPSPPESDEITYAEARAAREAINAQMAQIAFKQKIGKLIEVEKVRTEWFSTCRNIRNAFQGLPDRTSAIVASLTDPAECHKVLSEEVNKILENLANGNRF